MSRPLFKGPGHRDYQRHLGQIETIFTTLFPNWSESSAEMIHKSFGIPKSTIYFWRQKWRDNQSWRPTNQVHGDHHRIFTDLEEQAISEYIFENFLLVNRLFTNEDFKQLIMDAFLNKHRETENPPEFQVSEGFIQDFKKRNMFSSRRTHPKKRPSRDAEKEARFMHEMSELLRHCDRDRILNVDETFWTCTPMDLRTWGKKGAEEVGVHVNAAEKQGLTVVACVTASGCKLPLYLIAKGKTELCHQQLGDPQGHLVGHSETGWSTVDTFSEFLLAVREHFNDDDPVYLLLDLYSVHRTDEIRQLAESLNIVLIFIPPGMTDQYQPLDRRIFGVLKQYLRLLWRREYHDDPNQRFTKQKAVQLLVPAWERISPQLIIEGWTIYEDQSDSD